MLFFTPFSDIFSSGYEPLGLKGMWRGCQLLSKTVD